MRKGNRISIRRIQRDDASAIYNIFSKSEVCDFYDLSPFNDLSQAVDQIEGWLRNYEHGRQVRYAICKDEEVIGTC
ncbi:GNAT family N-acetyltransferase [Salinispira pacifica]|uniref:GNAT family N-acetyltransferase n=1 Tax=Salinispira pacifica TaxID=1307761 RepID=UPI003CC72164